MQTILNFLIKHNHWFLFILLEGISFMLIVRFNNYQGATFFTAANGAVGGLYSAIANVDTYFGLQDENESLLAHNRELVEENALLRNRIAELKSREALFTDSVVQQIGAGYNFHTAAIVSGNSGAGNNFYVINKGAHDGIKSEMGVFNSKGVVGIIYQSSTHYSLVLPLLNSKSRTSCKVRGDNTSSILQWDGKDTRYSHLVDLPRHTRIAKGDTVVTSGHSAIFPEEIPIGVIDKIEDSADGMFYLARVELFVNFSTLSSVFIVAKDGYEEQKELERKITKE
ncbi:MAG: rod shape-determining protein MreC [Bacteroidaceae bacterium]|nr:rod shape-determining protein MreC [Bacteroidaceae bacterium]